MSEIFCFTTTKIELLNIVVDDVVIHELIFNIFYIYCECKQKKKNIYTSIYKPIISPETKYQ